MIRLFCLFILCASSILGLGCSRIEVPLDLLGDVEDPNNANQAADYFEDKVNEVIWQTPDQEPLLDTYEVGEPESCEKELKHLVRVQEVNTENNWVAGIYLLGSYEHLKDKKVKLTFEGPFFARGNDIGNRIIYCETYFEIEEIKEQNE